MSSQSQPDRLTGPLALATGGLLFAGLLCLILFYTIGGLWGTLNDAANGLGALLSAVLVWRLHRARPTRGGWVLASAGLGAAIAMWGSYLVMTGRTGWYLAGLYTSLGYALLGLALWATLGALAGAQPRGLRRWGRFTGAFMALGLLALPGIVAGVDSALTRYWWAHLGFAGGLGWVLVFPVWCLWLGRAFALRRMPALA